MPRTKRILDPGTGRLEKAYRIKCPVCHGRPREETCGECRGRGEIWSTDDGGAVMRKYGRVGVSEKRKRRAT